MWVRRRFIRGRAQRDARDRPRRKRLSPRRDRPGEKLTRAVSRIKRLVLFLSTAWRDLYRTPSSTDRLVSATGTTAVAIDRVLSAMLISVEHTVAILFIILTRFVYRPCKRSGNSDFEKIVARKSTEREKTRNYRAPTSLTCVRFAKRAGTGGEDATNEPFRNNSIEWRQKRHQTETI